MAAVVVFVVVVVVVVVVFAVALVMRSINEVEEHQNRLASSASLVAV